LLHESASARPLNTFSSEAARSANHEAYVVTVR
jgi:hypothetical protein